MSKEIDIYNNRYIIEKEKNKNFGIYIKISIILLTILVLIIVNFNYVKTTNYYIEDANEPILIDLQDRFANIYVNNQKIKFKYKKKKSYYQAKIKLKEYKRIKIEVEEKTTIYKSIIYDLRKEISNAEIITK